MNIDSSLLVAHEAAARWTAAAATDVARDLGGRRDAVIDWDEGAGESWVRIVAGRTVVAYVSTVLPLAIIERDAMLDGEPDSRIQWIVVAAMANPELSSNRAALEAAFGDSSRLDTLNAERFSADDLWYATV
jgi:hypothetical protein